MRSQTEYLRAGSQMSTSISTWMKKAKTFFVGDGLTSPTSQLAPSKINKSAGYSDEYFTFPANPVRIESTENEATSSMGLFRRWVNTREDIGTSVAKMTTTWSAQARAVGWRRKAARIAIMDLPDAHGRSLSDESRNMVKKDLPRMNGASGAEKDMLRVMLEESMELFPVCGYNQGFASAALVILRGTGYNLDAALRTYISWAVTTSWVIFSESTEEVMTPLRKSVCYGWDVACDSFDGLQSWIMADRIMGLEGSRGHELYDGLTAYIFLVPLLTLCAQFEFANSVQVAIVEKTLQAGQDGPAVAIFVTTCLLGMAFHESRSKKHSGVWSRQQTARSSAFSEDDEESYIPLADRLKAAAQRVSTWNELEDISPMSLREFLAGYRWSCPNELTATSSLDAMRARCNPKAGEYCIL